MNAKLKPLNARLKSIMDKVIEEVHDNLDCVFTRDELNAIIGDIILDHEHELSQHEMDVLYYRIDREQFIGGDFFDPNYDASLV